MTIWFYLIRQFTGVLFQIFLFVMGIVLTFDLVSQYQIFSDVAHAFGRIFILVILRLPQLLYLFIPLIVLLSAIFFFLRLSKNSELVVLRSAGISGHFIIFALASVCFGLGLILIGPLNRAVVDLRILAVNFQNQNLNENADVIYGKTGDLWLHEAIDGERRHYYIARILKLSRIEGVEIFIDTPDSTKRSIYAKTADVTDREMILHDVTLNDMNMTQKLEVMSISTRIKRDFFVPRDDRPEYMSNFKLPEYIKARTKNEYDTRTVKAYFYGELALPLQLALMVLIGAVFALAPMRGGGTSSRVLLALVAGFTAFIVSRVALGLAGAGYIPPILASFLVPVLSSFLAIVVLIQQEEK